MVHHKAPPCGDPDFALSNREKCAAASIHRVRVTASTEERRGQTPQCSPTKDSARDPDRAKRRRHSPRRSRHGMWSTEPLPMPLAAREVGVRLKSGCAEPCCTHGRRPHRSPLRPVSLSLLHLSSTKRPRGQSQDVIDPRLPPGLCRCPCTVYVVHR